jgi:hypothetical protein
MKYLIITFIILYFVIFTMCAINPQFKEYISNPNSWVEALNPPLKR